MIKPASNSSSTLGTSFHGQTVNCSYNDLVKVLGLPQYADNTGKDKTNYGWDCEDEDGTIFTIYDWKEYERISNDQRIEWHIGAHSYMKSIDAFCAISKTLGHME
jgi:hypothetical protein